MRRQLTVLPDFHFLLVAPELGAEWLFDAARLYWDRFRPIVVSDTRLIVLIPVTRPVGVTVLARRDTISTIGVELAQRAPSAYFDPLRVETIEEARAILNARAESNQPFGVAMATPFPTFDPNATESPLIPTPFLPPTRGPAGFVTATPQPPPPGEGTPAQTPIQPTPGSIIGGS